VLLDQISGSGVIIEGAGFELGNLNADQVARDIMKLGKPVKGLAHNEFLRHLPLEIDAVTTVLGHRPSPSEGPAYPVNSRCSICPLTGTHS